MTYSDIINLAIATFGEKHQIIKAIEELSELQKELCKFLEGSNDRLKVVEELADVCIMSDQIKQIFDPTAKVFIRKKTEKMERLQNRLENMQEIDGFFNRHSRR